MIPGGNPPPHNGLVTAKAIAYNVAVFQQEPDKYLYSLRAH
jgi:hypothetical protein